MIISIDWPLVPDQQVEDALEDNNDDIQDVLRYRDMGWRPSDELTPLLPQLKGPHPNEYTFIQFIQKKRTANETTVIQLAAVGVLGPKKKYRHLDQRIHDLKERLRRRHIHFMDYVDAAFHLFWMCLRNVLNIVIINS